MLHDSEYNVKKSPNETNDSSQSKEKSINKMITIQPDLYKEMESDAKLWAGGNFSAFVAMTYQMFKMEMDKKKSK